MFADKKILKEISGIFAGNIASLFFGFLTGIILSRVLGPELKGVYTTLMVVPGIISSFIMFGSRPSVIYHTGKKIFSGEQVISAVFFLWIISCITGIILFLAAYWLILDKVYTLLMIALVILYIPIKLVITHSGSIFLANLQFRKANMLKWLTSLLTVVMVFIFVFIFRLSITGAIFGLITASAIVLIITVVLIGKESGLKIHYDKKVISQIFSMGIVYALALFVVQLNFRIDILILNILSTKEEIGVYSVGVSVAEKLWLLPFAIGVVLVSRSAAAENVPEMTKDVSRLLRLAFLIILAASVILYFVSPWLIPLIYGKAFTRSTLVVQNILPGILFFVVVRIISSCLAGIGKPWIILYIFIPALAINIILNYLWIPAYGCLGAAWATNVSYTAGALAVLFAFSRITKTSLWSIIRYSKEDFMFMRTIREFKKSRRKTTKNYRKKLKMLLKTIFLTNV